MVASVACLFACAVCFQSQYCSKQSNMWDREKTIKLIEFYENHSVLWDASSADYKNKHKKQNAYREIAEELDKSNDEIKPKIHHLRTQFLQEVRRVKQKKCGQATSDNYTSKWEFFDALNFIQNGDGSNYEIQKLKVHANCLRRHLKSPVNLKIDVKLCETFINAFCNWIRIKASLGVTNRKAFRMPST
ncbi:uncharacterized protein LOC133835276 isoform X2 [Drosophila sulfurigaster albostrigata]|uniref:uncharacterized protein LOC133835276 isoform X2 n=1 Tax=Drosophila sulfurigaster albostrigata TaxID=89887 RepID=UPI002D21B069|nr:uncharacterized protein LOC133835276 isoform X2 [Drosophila sulfurigaster albostrigata]